MQQNQATEAQPVIPAKTIIDDRKASDRTVAKGRPAAQTFKGICID